VFVPKKLALNGVFQIIDNYINIICKTSINVALRVKALVSRNF